LQGMAYTGNLAGNYVLGANIDASATSTWNPIVNNKYLGFAPIGSSNAPFTGIFDGLGHTISDLTIDRPTSSNVGLFGISHGTLENVGLVGGSVKGKYDVGGLVGWNSNGAITDVYATGSVSGIGSGSTNVGGLV